MAPRIAKLIQALIETANQHMGGDFTQELKDALNALAEATQPEPGEIRSEILKAVSETLVSITSPSGAGLMAVWLGSSVEQGRDPAVTAAGVADAMLKWSRSIVTAAEDSEDPEPEADHAHLTGLELLGQALVAHLSHSEEVVEECRGNAEFMAEVERIEHVSVGAMWVMQIFRQRSGRLMVLEAGQGRGAIMTYQNIANCFHLFTLLQGALSDWLPAGERATAAALARAASDPANGGREGDEARWHYGQPTVPRAEFAGMIFGEAAPDSIMTVEGQQVLLLWPKILGSRSWDAGFFGPLILARLPSMRMERLLTADEIAEWSAKLKLPEKVSPSVAQPPPEQRPRKPWWKFF